MRCRCPTRRRYRRALRADGQVLWVRPGTTDLHRLDGPAKYRVEDSEEWWVAGHRHRVDGPARTLLAALLSTAGGVVIQVGERIEVLRDDGLPVRVIFDRVPPNLRARPTLSVTVESNRGGTRPASIRYLTPGLGWSSDYVALYDEGRGTIDMQGWVTLTNTTGTTFHGANTLLVAGNPNTGGGSPVYRGRPMPPPPPPGRGMVPGTETAERERLGDFYLYPIAERTTIANNQTKQVSFLDVQGVPARKVYGRTVGWLASDSQPVNVASQIAFSSSREGGQLFASVDPLEALKQAAASGGVEPARAMSRQRCRKAA